MPSSFAFLPWPHEIPGVPLVTHGSKPSISRLIAFWSFWSSQQNIPETISCLLIEFNQIMQLMATLAQRSEAVYVWICEIWLLLHPGKNSKTFPSIKKRETKQRGRYRVRWGGVLKKLYDQMCIVLLSNNRVLTLAKLFCLASSEAVWQSGFSAWNYCFFAGFHRKKEARKKRTYWRQNWADLLATSWRGHRSQPSPP